MVEEGAKEECAAEADKVASTRPSFPRCDKVTMPFIDKNMLAQAGVGPAPTVPWAPVSARTWRSPLLLADFHRAWDSFMKRH